MIVSTNKTPWCINPFTTFSISSDGRYKLCCQSKEISRFTVDNYSVEDFFSSEYMDNIRKKMLAENISDGEIRNLCECCIKEENKGVLSKRQKDNYQHIKSKRAIRSVDAFINKENDKYDVLNIKFLSINMLGNLCNYKCIMCYPGTSSRIASENIMNNIGTIKKPLIVPYNTEFSKKRFFESMFEVFSNVETISFYGGELLINPDFEEVFNKLKNMNNAKNINICLITNASRVPDYILDNKKFKSFRMLVSVDGVGARGEFIRYGSNWKNVDANISKFKENGTSVIYNIAIQLLNIGYIDEIYDYILNVQKSNKKHISNCYVNFPEHFDAVNLPRKIKDQYLEKLSKDPNAKFYKNIIFPILEKNGDHDKFMRGIKQLKAFDMMRNTNFTDIFSEFKEYL